MKMANVVFIEIRGTIKHIKYYSKSSSKLHTKSISHTRLSRNSQSIKQNKHTVKKKKEKERERERDVIPFFKLSIRA